MQEPENIQNNQPIAAGSDEHGLTMPRRLFAVTSISCGSVLYTLDGSIANVAMPTIGETLHTSSSTVILLISVYNLVLAMVLLPFAALGERFGHARVFRAGFLFYLAASLGCLASGSFPTLLIFRALQAVAAASLLSVSLAMVRMVYPANMLGRGLGFNTMASTLGAAVAPPIGGLLIAHGPWQGVFSVGIPLAIVGLLASTSLPDTDSHESAFDKAGALLCAFTFGLLIGGLQALSQGANVVLCGLLIVFGCLVGLAFVRHESRTRAPVLPVDLLGQPALALSIVSALMAVLASTALLIYLPFRLHALGFGSATVGAMIAPYAIAVMIVAPSSGMLSDRISPMLLGTIGMALAVAGLLALTWLPNHPGFADVVWRSALCGTGFSLFFSPNGRMVVGAVPRQRAAGASSLLSTTRMLGQALGATGLAGLLGLRLSPTAPSLIAAAIGAVSLLCCVARMVIRCDAPAR